MRAIDTNVLVRLITRDDAGEAAATEDFIEQGAWVSVVVLADAMWRLARFYKLSPEDLAKAIEMLLHHRDLVIQDAEAVAGALELFRSKPALGFSDCLILQLARKAGHLPLGTFDRGLAKVEGTQKI
jgi:predicted nucleic-acid-binding protein